MPTDGLFSYAQLGTVAGAAMITYLLTAYTKDTVRGWVSPPKVAVVYAFAVWVVAQIANGASPTDWTLYPLSLANAFMIAIAAGKVHDIAQPGDEGVPAPLGTTISSGGSVVYQSSPIATVPATGQTVLPPADPTQPS